MTEAEKETGWMKLVSTRLWFGVLIVGLAFWAIMALKEVMLFAAFSGLATTIYGIYCGVNTSTKKKLIEYMSGNNAKPT